MSDTTDLSRTGRGVSRNRQDRDDVTRFTEVFDATYSDLVRFVRRREATDISEDVVAETFLVAWRRLDDLPPASSAARAWLFGIARGVMLNESRGSRRRDALNVRLGDTYSGQIEGPDDLVASQVDMSRAWLCLAAVHQEALALAVLDGLDAPEAASVLGISPVAFRLRLSRARRALRSHLEHLPSSTTAPQGDLDEQHV
jgi:RNA polymerase sigma-70 factor (ECF subfamily)